MDLLPKAWLEASRTRVINFDTPFHEFNALGVLSNVRFGSLKGGGEVGTCTFTIEEVGENGKPNGVHTTKWAYASQLEAVLTLEGDNYSYDGGKVSIVGGKITKAK